MYKQGTRLGLYLAIVLALIIVAAAVGLRCL